MSDSAAVDSLVQRLAVDMRRRWDAGERPLAEEYLGRHPGLRAHPEAAAELIYEEICLRRSRGQPGASGEVLRRFPEWAAQLRLMLELYDTLDADAEPDYPAVGDTMADFEVIEELGRGSRGRVYLARQPSLAGRLVVVKVTPRSGGEHQALARLQHTHIMPLYAAYDDPPRRARVLYMPYFGGATLAAVLQRMSELPVERRTGGDLGAALGGPSDAPPRRAGYPEAIAALGACLADALAFAHERGLLHLDVKPSNVLLTADGQPMLLDFHLAREPIPAGSPAPPWLGGTRGYASPEQAAALDAVRRGTSVAVGLDGRSDVSSLGVVLFEALAGHRPPADPVPVRRSNPQVSTGLSDIVCRCLRRRPEDRYPDAAALADDLRRHLADLPLRGVRNRDLGERWGKWRRRRPHALGGLGALLVLVAGVGLVTGYTALRLSQGRAALDEGAAELRQGHFASARAAFQRGRAGIADLPFRGGLTEELNDGLRRVERAEAAGELHRVAEQFRSLADGHPPPDAERAAAEGLGRRFWARRGELFALLDEELPQATRQQIRADLFELALLWSRLAGPREAVAILRETETALGAAAVLALERAAHADTLGLAAEGLEARQQAERLPPRSAWEHYALGCHHLRNGDAARARDELRRALDGHPGAFWPRFYLGRCELLLGRPDQALVAFTVCVALRPERPFVYVHRAAALARLGQTDEAIADVERALRLEPADAAALELREALRR